MNPYSDLDHRPYYSMTEHCPSSSVCSSSDQPPDTEFRSELRLELLQEESHNSMTKIADASPKSDASSGSPPPEHLYKQTFYATSQPSGRRIEYHLRGKCRPRDPIMVLVHGAGYLKILGWSKGMDFVLKVALKDHKLSREEVANMPFTIVCMFRAGYSNSTLKTKGGKTPATFSYSDFVDDLKACVDDCARKVGYLGPEGSSSEEGAGDTGVPFCLFANSSGGPCSIAAAALLPERVTGMVILSGDASYDPAIEDFDKVRSFNADSTNGILDRSTFYRLNPKDKEEVIEKEVKYYDGFAPCRRNGSCGLCCCASSLNPCCWGCPSGLTADLHCEVRPWEFGCEGVRCPVWLFAGQTETDVDPNTTRYNALKIPHAVLHIVEGEGTHPVPLPKKLFDTTLCNLRNVAVNKHARESAVSLGLSQNEGGRTGFLIPGQETF